MNKSRLENQVRSLTIELDLEGPLIEVITRLETARDHLGTFAETAEISVDADCRNGYGDAFPITELRYKRPETDAEVLARLKLEELRAKQEMDRNIRQYKMLKEMFKGTEHE